MKDGLRLSPLKNPVILVGVLASLALGSALRLGFSTDIEYKSDERTMFRVTQAAGRTAPWPSLGMVSGAALQNPPLSLWAPTLLARATFAKDPVALARRIELVNVAALVLAFLLALRFVPPRDREAWLWAAALASVSPIAILFSRKIWAQSLLPFFCALFLIGWFRREKRTGALGWGLLGALLGQIHMSGFFFALGVLIWTTLAERKAPRTRWGFWLAGSALGGLPMLPWIAYLLAPHAKGPGFSAIEIFRMRFWTSWFDDALGLQMNYSLGSAQHWDWMRYPLLGGHATFLVAGCSLFLAVAGARALFIAMGAVRTHYQNGTTTHVLLGAPSDTRVIGNAVFLGMGLLITLSGLALHRHYLIITFPLEWLWLAMLFLQDPAKAARGRRWLQLIFVAELILSATFLLYIHENDGARTGDYGQVFSSQSLSPPAY